MCRRLINTGTCAHPISIGTIPCPDKDRYGQCDTGIVDRAVNVGRLCRFCVEGKPYPYAEINVGEAESDDDDNNEHDQNKKSEDDREEREGLARLAEFVARDAESKEDGIIDDNQQPVVNKSPDRLERGQGDEGLRSISELHEEDHGEPEAIHVEDKRDAPIKSTGLKSKRVRHQTPRRELGERRNAICEGMWDEDAERGMCKEGVRERRGQRD